MSGIRVELELDSGQFTTRILHAGESLTQFNRNVGAGIVSMRQLEGQGRSLLSTMRDVAVVVGIGGQAINQIRQISTGWIGDIVRVNAEMERLSVLMRTLSRASDPVRDAANNVAYLRQVALNAPYSLQALTDVFIKMKSAGLDPTRGALMSLVDGVAAFGGTEETLKRATIALQQMAGKGVIQMEELRQQLGEAIPRATELMARGLGVGYAKLVQDIATGRVEATTSLRALEIEMRNTFGGAAQEQMQTFSGLISTIGTSLQDLALKIGNSGFFDNVKRQLTDLKAALGSNVANVIAADIGAALNSAITVLRDVVEWVVRYRNEIVSVGAALIGAFALQTVIRSLLAFGGTLAGISTQITLIRGQWAAAMATITANAAAGATGIAALGVAFRSFSAALIPIAGVLGIVAGWLPIVIGLGAAAVSYFGLFSNKLRESWENSEKYGFQSRKQVEEADAYIRKKEEELATVIETRNRRLSIFNNQGGRGIRSAISAQYDPDIASRTDEVDQLRASRAKLGADFETRQIQDAANVRVEAIRKQEQVEQRAYDDRAIKLKQVYDKERAELAAKNKSVAAIDEQYGENSRKIALDLLERKLSLYQGFYDELNKLVERSSGVERAGAEKTLDTVRPILNQLYDDINFKRQQLMGTPLIQPTLDDDKLYKKGQQALLNIEAQVTGLKASLKGASAEVVELNEKLVAGKYGDADVKRVRELIDSLVEAQRQKEALDEILEGRKKFSNDIANLTTKLQQDILAAQTQGLGDVDKLIVAINNGIYKSIGPGQNTLQGTILGINKEVSNLSVASVAAGSSLRNSALGQAVVSAGQGVIGVVDRLNDSWTKFRQNVESTNPAAAFDKLGGAFKQWQNATSPLGDFTPTSTSPQPNQVAAIASVSPLLQKVIELARQLSPVGFEIVEGARSIERQRELVASGKSQTLDSQHLTGSAFDFVAVGSDGKRTYDEKLMRVIADAFKAAAQQIGIGVNWGGDWKRFVDTPHVELQAPYRPVNARDSRLQTPSGTTLDQQVEIEKLRILEQQKLVAEGDRSLKTAMDDLKASVTEVGTAAEGANKHVASIRKNIELGKYGSDKNPDADRYKEILKVAAQLDAVETASAKKKRDRSVADNATEAIARSEEDLAARIQAAQRRIIDPQQLRETDAFFRKRKELMKQTDAIGGAFGFDSAEYKRALQDAQNQLIQFRNIEAQEAIASYALQNQELRRNLMTESQAREDETNKEIERARKVLAEFKGTAEERALAEQVVQDRIALLRLKNAQSGPWVQQLKQWKDVWGNIEQSATTALGNVTDEIAKFVTTGKADFASLFQSVAQDIVKQVLRFSVSSLLGFGGKTGGAAGAGGSSVSIMELLAKLGSKLFGGFRAGGGDVRGDKLYVVGEKGPELFAPGAHGSIVSNDVLRSIRPPDASVMQSISPSVSSSMVFAPVVNIQGGGGSHADNRDLSRQMLDQMRTLVRHEFAEQVRQQQRPNGILSRY